jgi:hypothetical protein
MFDYITDQTFIVFLRFDERSNILDYLANTTQTK